MDSSNFVAVSGEEAVSLGAVGFVAIMGQVNVGKSTLLNAILGEKIAIVTPKSHTTRNRILGIKTSKDSQVIFVDTPGFVSRGRRSALTAMLESETQSASAEVDVAMLVVDGPKAIRDSQYASQVFGLWRSKHLRFPDIICINKVDLIDKRLLLPVIAALNAEFGEHGNKVDIVPISAKTGDGLEVLETAILARLAPGPKLFPDDVVTDQTERGLVSEIIREKLFMYLSQELPYSLAVEVESWEEKGELLNIGVVIYVERESQKGIVIGAKGAMLKKVGVAARRELEAFFGVQVNLRLFVRVQADWTSSGEGMARVGIRSNK